MKEQRPNVFLVGAPKCGTTAIYHYLQEHPQVFLTTPKEPFFFCEDFPSRRVCSTWDDYLSLFEPASSNHAAIGEASVLYLASRVAIGKLAEFAPDARIVVALRNPIDMLTSWHAQCLYTEEENEKDIERAWALQTARDKGSRVPKTTREPEFLQYRRFLSFPSQIRRVLEHFDRSQVHFLLFDDLKRSARTVYEAILNFLQLASDGRSEFPVVNARKARRFKPLRVVRDGFGPMLPSPVLAVYQRTGLNRLYSKLVHYTPPKRPLRPEFQRCLLDEFSSDIDELCDLLKRDLTHWKDIKC